MFTKRLNCSHPFVKYKQKRCRTISFLSEYIGMDRNVLCFLNRLRKRGFGQEIQQLKKEILSLYCFFLICSAINLATFSRQGEVGLVQKIGLFLL